MFVHCKLYQQSVMLWVKRGAYRCSAQVGYCLTFQHYTRLERLVGEKHSGLLSTFVSRGEKSFVQTGQLFLMITNERKTRINLINWYLPNLKAFQLHQLHKILKDSDLKWDCYFCCKIIHSTVCEFSSLFLWKLHF